ncbi:MAG: transcriptional regulator [Desulfobacteraceae bacterium IS3]|nr:MAG: transcriptional regulator [Desulfobacteraceae bacterium IS3]
MYYTPSLSKTLDRIENIRSGLRWTPHLDRDGIQKVFRQMNDLRQDMLILSSSERYVRKQKTSAPAISAKQRIKALADRNFVFKGVFGENPKISEILEIIEKTAKTDMPILIQGESGTGKELLSAIVHANSHRAEQPFVTVNCGAIVPTLLESELFGHVRGAFTGAVKDRKGKFETADNGTIFLDEIAELPLESQVKLLRVLESGDIQRVGSDEMIRVNTRIVAATHRNLHKMMSEGKFREDLYYRLSVISLTLPPLRERRDEIGVLSDYLCKEAAEKLNRPEQIGLSPKLRNFLMDYAYPGNIRELKNIIYRISCLAEDMADISHLPDMIRPPSEQIPKKPIVMNCITLEHARKTASEAAERQFLEDQLRKTKGNVTVLAKQLDMNRSYLQTLLKKQGVKPSDFKK